MRSKPSTGSATATSSVADGPPRRRLRGWRPRFGLRLMLLVALLPLLGLPWIGLRFVDEMAELARDERLENLVVAARNLATSLHERPELFAATSGSNVHPPDSEPITLDLLGPAGRPDDGSRQVGSAAAKGCDGAGLIFCDKAGDNRQNAGLELGQEYRLDPLVTGVEDIG